MHKRPLSGIVTLALAAQASTLGCSSNPAHPGSSGTGATSSTSGSSSTNGSSGVGGAQPSSAASSGGPSSGTTGGAGTGGDSGTVTPPGCQASCTGKTCGDDGCSGTCGGCAPNQLCGPAQTCIASPSTTSIVVDAKSQGTVISPGIYGVALNSDDSMQLAGLNRWGGDATGSYNWETDAFNSGDDWYCANYTGLFTAPSPDASLKSSSDQFVHYNITQKADTLMTIPLTGWVANMATPNATLQGMASCGDAVTGVYDQTLTTQCCKDLGTSQSKLVDKGSSTLDTSYMSSWVQHLVSTFGTAAKGGVKYYQLDNEPDNWQYLRPDIYPSLYPPGTPCADFYGTNASIGKSLNQDFIDRTMAYAKAVKAADPTANVLFMSTENAQDLVALPNVECGNPTGPYTVDSSLTEAILKLGAMQESTAHQRVLDCVDMHYPFPGKGLGDTAALWSTAAASGYVPPHIQGWINATYPGTGICVSEYNVSNDGTNGNAPDVTTGTQEADILGMYGRLGYKLAAYWTSLVYKTTHLPVYNAMAMYRNYDGKGGQFGAYSIGAASPNSGVNVYASADSPTSPTKVWIMLVNVSGATQNNLSITLQNFTPSGSALVFRSVGGAAPKADVAATITGGGITGFSLASNSVALLALSK